VETLERDKALVFAQACLFRALIDTHPDPEAVSCRFEQYMDDLIVRCKSIAPEDGAFIARLERFAEEMQRWTREPGRLIAD
jgi:hypothetical protein